MTDEHGDVVYGTRFELSENFRDGFIDSVQALTTDKTRFTSPRGERMNGDVTVLEKASLHRVRALQGPPRAAAVLAGPGDQDHREPGDPHGLLRRRPDARLGLPGLLHALFLLARLDRQQADRLACAAVRLRGNLGYGISLPYFINLAPNYDLTADPDLPVEAGLPRRGRLAPAAGQRPVQHQDDRHRPAAAQRLRHLFLTARATRRSAARSRPRATSFSTRTGSSAGTPPGCRTSSSPTITSCRASISATTISRTSSRRSTCADRPTTASSTSAPITSRARPRTTTTGPCRRRCRCSTTIACSLSRRPHQRARRPGDGRRQHRQHQPDQRGVPVDRSADLRQRLPSLQRLRDVGRQQVREHLLSRRLHAAQHRRRLHARLGAGFVAAQLHRPDRRGLEAVRVCAARRRSDRAQRDRVDHLRERARNEHGRQFQPGGVLLRRQPGRVRARHGRLRARVPVSVRAHERLGLADDHADRAVHRPPERGHSADPAERGRAEPRVRRDEPVRLEQVLRLRPHRGRHAAQLRRCSTRPISPTAATPTSSPAN